MGPTASRQRPVVGPRLGVLLVVAALVVAELGLARLGWGQRIRFTRDAQVGVRPVAGQDGLLDGVAVHVNARGFRDDEWEPAGAGPERLRVAVLGNSVTFGLGVAAEQRWTAWLERALGAQLAAAGDARSIEVLNLGLPGCTLRQMLVAARRDALALRPDVILFALTTWDVRERGPLPSERRKLVASFVRSTALYDFLRRGVGGADDRPGGERGDAAHGRAAPELREASWEQAFSSLRRRLPELVAGEARVLVVSLPSPAAGRRLPGPDEGARRWASFCAVQPGVAHLDLSAVARQGWDAKGLHLSAAGHRELGEAAGAALGASDVVRAGR